MPTRIPVKIQRDHNQRPIAREKGRCKQGIDRKLCRAAHKGSEQDRHLPIPFGGKGAARHNARYGTAKSHQHGNNTPAGQTDFSQQFIHDKGDSGHIAAVFQYGQEEKQRYNNG